MNGWLADGTSVELTTEQERIARGLIEWHENGTPFLLPKMGRASGKTTIMSTAAYYSHLGRARNPMITSANVQPGDFCCLPASDEDGRLSRVGKRLNGSAFTEYKRAEIYVGDPAQKTLMRGQVIPKLRMSYGWTLSAHPSGARLKELGCSPEQLPGALWSSGAISLTDAQRNDIVAVAMQCQSVKYSALDYLALAAHRLGMKDPALRRYIASGKHMQPARLVDHCYDEAGIHLFDDKRWNGYVTPADLAARIHEHENGSST